MIWPSGNVCKATGFLSTIGSRVCKECAFWLVHAGLENRKRLLYTIFTFVRIQFAKWCPHHCWYENYHSHNYADNDGSPSTGVDHDSTLHLRDISNQVDVARSWRGKCKLCIKMTDKFDIKIICIFVFFTLQFCSIPVSFWLNRKAISKGLPVIMHVARNNVIFKIIHNTMTSLIYITWLL